MMSMDDRQRQVIEYRMEQANALLNAMASHGPRAFYSPVYELTAYFYVDSVLQGWLVDYRTGMKQEASRAPVLYDDAERGLLLDLLEYIRTGKAIDTVSIRQFDYDSESAVQMWDEIKDLDLISNKSA
jgi:hypothetical protein